MAIPSMRPATSGSTNPVAFAAPVVVGIMDTVKVYLRVENGIIEEISFQGEGCAIGTASTSLMTESVKGKSVAEVKEIFDGFHEMLTGVAAEQGVTLGKLQVFEGVREYPVRVKCATLAWHTLNAAMDGDEDSVTTE